MSGWCEGGADGGVLTLALGFSVGLAAGARVHLHLSSHDEFVLHKLSNVLACTHSKEAGQHTFKL